MSRGKKPGGTSRIQELAPVERVRLLRTWSARKGAELARDALELGDQSDSNGALDLLQLVGDLVPGGLGEVHGSLLDRRWFWDSDRWARWELLRGASAAVRSRLLDALASGAGPRDGVLQMLGEIGDAVVQKTFRNLRKHSSRRDDELEYAMSSAGWTLDAKGRYRKLYREACRELGARPARRGAPLRIAVPREHRCPWCNRSLVDFLDWKLARVGASCAPLLPRSGRLRLACCERCTVYTSINPNETITFGRFTLEGTSELIMPSEGRPDEPTERDASFSMEGVVTLGARRRSPVEARTFLRSSCSSHKGMGLSQLGGRPSWGQSPCYPTCPSCREMMPFLAQVDTEALGGPGLYYTFVCPRCRIGATEYQGS